VEAVTEVTEIIGRISGLSNEETEYFTAVADGFRLISDLTRSSSGRLSESEAAAGELAKQLEGLRKLCSEYKSGSTPSKTVYSKAARETAGQAAPRRADKAARTPAPKTVNANGTINFNAGKARMSPESKRRAKEALTQVIKLNAVREKRAREADKPEASAISIDPRIYSSTDFGKY
jgi:hypothetical protein